MPTFKTGVAQGGAITAAALDYVQKQQKQREEREGKQREFNQELIKLGIKVALEDRTLAPELDKQGVFTGRFVKGAGKPKEQSDFLPSTTTAALLGQAQPGQPLPMTRPGALDPLTGQARALSNIPIGPQGINTMDQAIRLGITESPEGVPKDQATAAQFPLFARQFPDQFAPAAPAPSSAGVGASLSVGAPQNRLSNFARSLLTFPLGLNARPSRLPPQPARLPPQPDVSQADVSEALQKGFSIEEIIAKLQLMGVDEATIAQLLQNAGA